MPKYLVCDSTSLIPVGMYEAADTDLDAYSISGRYVIHAVVQPGSVSPCYNVVQEDGVWKAFPVRDFFEEDNMARAFAMHMMSQLKVENITNGINAAQALWVHHRFRAVEITMGGVPMVIDILNLVISGDLTVAYIALNSMVPDDMTQPHHWLSAERILDMKLRIGRFLGWNA